MIISLSVRGVIQYLHLLKTVASTSGKMSTSSIFGTSRWMERFSTARGEERCDFLLINDESTPKTSYYIELKGSDLPKAIRQIENTIKLLSPSLPGYVVLRRIVYHTGSHNVHASEVLRWKAKYKAVVKEREYSENI